MRDVSHPGGLAGRHRLHGVQAGDGWQHVAFGTKWLPELMANNNIELPLDQFIEETVTLWRREYMSGDLPLHTVREAEK